MIIESPAIEWLRIVAKRLGELRDDVVFLGGATVALLLLLIGGCSGDSNSRPDLSAGDATDPLFDGRSADGPVRDASAVDLTPADGVEADGVEADGPAVADHCPTGDPSLALCLPFEDDPQGGTMTDHSGGGHHGTVMGAPTSVAGMQGQALAFSGGPGEHVVVPASSGPVPASIKTIEAWVRLDAMPPGPVGVVDRGSDAIAIVLATDGGKPRLGCNAGGNMINETIALGAWVHIACMVAETGHVEMYVDGTGGSSVLMALSPVTCDLRIGAACEDHDERGFPGAIDSVRIFSRALSREELCLAAGRTWNGSCL